MATSLDNRLVVCYIVRVGVVVDEWHEAPREGAVQDGKAITIEKIGCEDLSFVP